VPGTLRILHWPSLRVGLVVHGTSRVTMDAHRAVSDIVGHSGPVGAIDGNLIVICAKSVSLRIGIREEPTLQHLIIAWLNAWHEVRGRERTLLHFCVVVLGVPVESHLANLL